MWRRASASWLTPPAQSMRECTPVIVRAEREDRRRPHAPVHALGSGDGWPIWRTRRSLRRRRGSRDHRIGDRADELVWRARKYGCDVAKEKLAKSAMGKRERAE